MPEYDVVRWYASLLQPLLTGRVVNFVNYIPHNATWAAAKTFPESCDGLRVERVYSHGKQLIINCDTIVDDVDANTNKQRTFIIHFGLSGHLGVMHNTISSTTFPKGILWYMRMQNTVLWMEDQDHMGRTRMITGRYDPKTDARGPDLLDDESNFRANILQGLAKQRNAYFDRPLHEIFTHSKSQEYFNGQGNQLRAELMFQGGLDPFENARTVLTTQLDHVIATMKTIANERVAALAAAQSSVMKDDLTLGYYDIRRILRPFNRCYENPAAKSMVDKNKRKLYYVSREVLT
jgi:formamidopyrimidine-DNA glycosylase